MGRYKEISIEQENLLTEKDTTYKQIDFNLEEINVDYENEKIPLREYLSKISRKVYLIVPKDRLHLWSWVEFKEKINGKLLEYKTKDNKILYQIIETENDITVDQLDEFDLCIADVWNKKMKNLKRLHQINFFINLVQSF
ncbi:hypothetical protein [Clostridium beijerinckii]|uniref:Uncharacterized protein n=1 Tax=Clostridium beijerinckii TaxID=1520 RepID=A0A1S8SKV8_CLOBE|nr:hypothetical protein [Clostridium beijerinckii]NRY63823.1 hypothetical protein [Clostridium beijerinckii]OOM66047.1 hypothetical protein CLBCK_00030 [Clostridium beijerinckii]